MSKISSKRPAVLSSKAIKSMGFATGIAVWLAIGAAPAQADQLKVTAGSTPASVPTAFLDLKTNQIDGVMPEVVREIGKREGFGVSYETIPFNALIQSVVSGKIDLIVAGMTPTPKRAEVIDFSKPVVEFGEGIIVSADDKNNYRSVADLKGTSVGAPAGTDYGSMLVKTGYFKEVKFYESAADMARDVAVGRIKAGFYDYPILKAQEMAGTLKGTRVDDNYVPMEVFPIAFGVKKGNADLLAKINDGLAKMKADGSLDGILRKWRIVK